MGKGRVFSGDSSFPTKRDSAIYSLVEIFGRVEIQSIVPFPLIYEYSDSLLCLIYLIELATRVPSFRSLRLIAAG